MWHAPYDAGDWILPRIIARAGKPVVRSHWDVHVEESTRLAYLVRDACEPADTEADFFVEPLEADAAEHGFHRITFSFGYWGVAAGGRCVAAVELPEHGSRHDGRPARRLERGRSAHRTVMPVMVTACDRPAGNRFSVPLAFDRTGRYSLPMRIATPGRTTRRNRTRRNRSTP